MNLGFGLEQVLLWVLVLLRISTAIAVMPLFGYRGVILPVKVGIAAFISLLIVPMVSVPSSWQLAQQGFIGLIGLVVPEIVVGLIIGLVTHFIFYGVELSGQFLGIQMGFGIVNVIDPQTEEQISIIAQLQYLFAVLIFLTFSGHHFLLSGLKYSYEVVPIGGVHFRSELLVLFIKMMGDLFVAGLKIAAPVMAALLLSEVALGIVARTVPQMNVFIVGFPLKIGLGLLALALSWPMFVYILELMWRNFQGEWWRFIGLTGP